MTASAIVLRTKSIRPGGGGDVPSQRASAPQGHPVPPLGPKLQLARSVLIVTVVLSVSTLLHLGFASSLQQRAAQGRSYDSFRAELARGTAPIGPADSEGVELALGRPVAYLEIRSIGLEQVVGEGTTTEVLFDGPGHRRDTPLPGQVGTSVLFGRSASYGGPFDRLVELTADDKITVTTGQGVFEYRVTGLRREGDPTPAPAAAGTARLTLITSDGANFFPSGLLRVDAELVGLPVIGPGRSVPAAGLPQDERAMENQTDTLWALALWMQGLIILSVAVIWGWLRWGRAQAWIVFIPALALVGMSAAGELAKLMPNLL